MATANQQVDLVSSVPDAAMSDTQLTNWLAQNQGKAYYDANGQQQIIPSGGSANAGTIRSWINGTMRGMSITPPAAAGAAAGAAPSYLSSPGGSGGSGNMTWNDIQNLGYTPQDLAAFQQRGWSPAQVMDSYQKGYSKPAPVAAAAPQQDAFGITHVDSGKGYTTLTNPKTGQTVNVDASGNYFTTDASGNNTPVSDTAAQGMGFQSTNPETQAQKQMQQIDPATEALRSQLASSYLPQMNQINSLVTQVTGQAPTSAADALAKYQQLDPQGYASIGALNTSEDASLKQATDQLALGSQLDPVTARQVEQQTRMGQAARGNVYGTPQMVQEAMTTGQAGLALQQQRQAAAQAAQGNMQSYLTSGATLGATGTNLYQQGLSNQQQALGLQQGINQSALSYLGSGQTPYQAGSTYLNNAEGAAANASQGGPVYQPAALGAGNVGTAQQAPQYGLDIGNQATNWYNSLSAQNPTTPAKNKTTSALTGAASGAASGATAGAAAGPYGALIGGAVGAVGGGLSGYYS